MPDLFLKVPKPGPKSYGHACTFSTIFISEEARTMAGPGVL